MLTVTGSETDQRILDRCTFASRLFERDLWIFTTDYETIFTKLFHTFNSKLPRHVFFANFRCLRCGQCCALFMPVRVHGLEIRKWIRQGREDILGHVWCFRKAGYCAERMLDNAVCVDCEHSVMQVEPQSAGRACPFLRRANHEDYYECCIHAVAPETCSGYLCQKSLPVAHLRWRSVNELIHIIGPHAYESVTTT